MFEQFEAKTFSGHDAEIFFRIGGTGPALLLLHGHPQTHMIWHKVADRLAQYFTVVAADLRGYGDSSRPKADPKHTAYSKRVMAEDSVNLMASLGYKSFKVLAHDRGARVAHRMAADHGGCVERLMMLDIAPTLCMYENTNEAFARAYWHWFFLIRPTPLPELLIKTDPDAYLAGIMDGRSDGMKYFSSEALQEYRRCIRIPGTAEAMCEDYRASASIDLEHDRQDIENGRTLECPVNILWGKNGAVGACFDVLAEWRKVAKHVTGMELPCGHYIPEEVPDLLLEQALSFLHD